MKKFYIIRSDGTSIFREPHHEEFIYHCLIKLLEKSDEHFKLLSFVESSHFPAVQADRGKGDESPLFAFLELYLL